MKMKLAHKIVVGFTVLVMLSGVFGTLVQFQTLQRISAALPSPSAEVTAIIAQARSSVLIIGVLTLVLGTLIAFVLTKQILTPIKAATLALEEHLRTGKAMSIQVPSRDELGILVIYLNELLKEPRAQETTGRKGGKGEIG